MMTRFLLSTIMVVISIASFCQQNIRLNDNTNNIQISESTQNGLKIENTVSNFTLGDAENNEGDYIQIALKGYAKSNTIGDPELPELKKLIRIPLGAEIVVENIQFEETTIDLNEKGWEQKIVPLQPSISKSTDMETVELVKNELSYNIRSFSNHNKVDVEILGIQRGVRIARVNIKPFDYNPIENTLKVYTNIKAEIVFVNADQKATTLLYSSTLSPFSKNTSRKMANNKAFATNEAYTPAMKYVIVSHTMFKDSLQGFIHWKTQMGYKVIEMYLNEDGVGSTPDEIKTSLKALYDNATPENPAPVYGLIVGDVGQVPSFNGKTGSHVSDLHYFEYTDDYFPEVLYGRFSANDNNELMAIINKTLEYEKYTMESKEFLNDATIVAGVDISWGPAYANAHVNYASQYYFNDENGFNTNAYLQPNSGNNAENIIQSVSDGLGILRYSGHCENYGWLDPEFPTSAIYDLENNGKYPLVVGNCCNSLTFDAYTSFGEAWLRQANKGAIGYIGASNLSYWVEDYYFDIGFGSGGNPSYEDTELGAMDALFHSNGEPEDVWAQSNAQFLNAGNMAVTLAGTDRVDYYWEVYHLMGDPSLMTYLTEPTTLTVSHASEIAMGMNKLTIEAEAGTYIGLSYNNTLIDGQFANTEGIASFNIPYFDNEIDLQVVATKQNRAPYIGNIDVIKSEEAMIIYDSHFVMDIDGNNDSIIEFGETASIDLSIMNIGFADASAISFELQCNEDFITITDGEANLDLFSQRTTEELFAAFSFEVNDDLLGSHAVTFNLVANSENNTTWEMEFVINIYAPIFEIGALHLNDSIGGNYNLNADQGEIIVAIIDLQNIGQVPSSELNCALTSSHDDVMISYMDAINSTINADEIISNQFSISIPADISLGDVIDFTIEFSSETHTFSENYTIVIGNLIEEFEGNNLSYHKWENEDTNPWYVFENSTNEQAFSGKYGLRSAKIDHEDTSAIHLKFTCEEADVLSFYKKVSSQPGNGNYYDYLEVLINQESMGKWDGETDWSMESYNLEAGTYEVTFRYIKSKFTSTGDDCAWIDLVHIPMDKDFFESARPEFTSTPENNVLVKENYAYSISVAGENISLSAVNLPTWLSLSKEDDNNFSLKGIPSIEDAGTYTILLSASNGIKNAQQSYTLDVVNPDGIETISFNQTLKIYPNPSSSEVFIAFEKTTAQNTSIKLYNLSGQLVKTWSVQSGNQEQIKLSIEEFDAGVYFIDIQSGVINSQQKLIISE